MKSISKLKDEARKHEQREAWESAIHAYLQVLAAGEEGENELEISLYNRVGDLFVRLNRSRDAVQYYEKAADRYADAGLFNNAIALCNKALRYMPDRVELLRKLGQYSAGQGFHTDARRYFLEYAEKQFAGGNLDAALRALEELAQVEDSADLRELMGHRLHASGRVAEALTHLKRAYELRLGAGEADRAEGLQREIALIDPAAFEGSPSPAVGQARLDARASAIAPADMDVLLSEPGAGPAAEAEPGGAVVVERPEAPAAAETPANVIDGFESGTFEGFSDIEEPAPLSGLETDDFEDQPEARVEVSDLERADGTAGESVATEPLPGLETGAPAPPPAGPDTALSFDLALIRYTDEPALSEPMPDEEAAEPAGPLPLLEDEPEAAGELPLLDDDAEPTALPLPLLEEEAAATETGTEAMPLFEDETEAEPLAADTVELPAIEEPEELASAPGWNFPSLTTDFPPLTTDRPPGRPPSRAPRPSFGGLDRELDDVLAGALERAAAEDRGKEVTPERPPVSRESPGGFGMVAPGETGQGAAAAAELPPLPPLTGWREPAPATPAPPRKAEPIATPPDTRQAVKPTEPEEAVTPPALPSLLSRAAKGMRAALERLDIAEPAAPEPPQSAREPYPVRPEPAPPAVEPARVTPEIARSAPFLPEAELEATREPVEAAAPPELAPPAAEAAEEVKAADAVAPEGVTEPTPEYMDLAAFLVEPEPEADTRFVVQERPPTGDEDQDFAELLSQFKQKVAEHVSVEDAAAHYDLGLAYKEMGLIEEAIGEFQVALRAGDMRLKVYEELGQCFLLRGQFNIAEKVLRRALESPFEDELELLGVYYHLGRACEELGKREAARDAYERVLGIDINFADVASRLARL